MSHGLLPNPSAAPCTHGAKSGCAGLCTGACKGVGGKRPGALEGADGCNSVGVEKAGAVVIGIDPGAHTGMALYVDGVLKKLTTIEPLDMAHAIKMAEPDKVIFEDSRLTSFMFTTVKSRPVALSMARKVGQVDGYCNLITSICERLGIDCHGISPKGKGKKLNADEFAKATGWTGSSNEHTRDSAMVAYPYRKASK